MKYSEELLWILDSPDGFGSTLEAQNETIQICTDFVHSLGLKCDCVGWCKMDLSSPRTPEILTKISEFCKENGWRARGWYTREYTDVQSDWYELLPSVFKDNTLSDDIETISANGKKINTSVIRAFHELSVGPKEWGEDIYVPERFYKFCLQHNIDEADFCWAKDKGKYEAEQYFHIYGKHLIPQIALDYDIKKTNTRLIKAAGGWLPEIADTFHEIQHIDLQDCYLIDDLPDSVIAYAYIPHTFSTCGRHSILLHKDIVQPLLQQKILSSNSLRPAVTVKSLPGGYSLKKTKPIERPTRKFMKMMLEEYEKLKNTPRPVRMVPKKDALKILRIAKKERKEDFKKALPKSKSQFLQNTDYNVLIPYYSIANGCYLSNEYELLPSAQAMAENEEFQEHLAKEEWIDSKPKGIVIGRCPDGDVVFLCNNGTVIRINHEEPVILEQWPTLPQFFVDTVSDI